MESGWHTYWRNAGDVGTPTKVTWQLPQGFVASDIMWPTPSKISYGEFVNFGYSNKVVFPVSLKIPANAQMGPQIIKAHMDWLQCKDVCVPGGADVSINITIGNKAQKSDNASIIEEAIKNLPAKNDFKTSINTSGKDLILSVVSQDLTNAKEAYFYPYEIKDGALIDNVKPQILELGNFGLSLKIPKSSSFKDYPDYKGVLLVDGAAYDLDVQKGAILNGVTGKKPLSSIDWYGLLRAIGFAFIGGLILNLMPCVFPILAMKIIGLTKIAHKEDSHAREYGVFYFLGVLITFLTLGSLIFAIKSMGVAIGWGFQLQDPTVLAVLIILCASLGFNLLGVFEFGLNLKIENDKPKSAKISALSSGILAVMVASPCTAPFMGAALGYALVLPPIYGLLVFVGLGLGFALPFMLLTFMPNLLSKLPKPGPWMEILRKILAIPMFITAAWLIWVLSASTSYAGVTFSILLIISLGILLWKNPVKNLDKQYWVGFALLIAIYFGYSAQSYANNIARSIKDTPTAQKWSDAAVAEALKSNKVVFVNFTADWCITCKVNEKSVFEDASVKEAFGKNNVQYFVADFTKHDENIARALSSHGRAGVPMYLIYKSGRNEPKILPQLLTPRVVINSLGE